MNLKKITTPITRNAKLLVTSSLFIIMAVSILNTWGTAQTEDTSKPAQRLVGHAWSETIGWISFNDGSRPVTIDAFGNLVGYGWSENIGWVKFGGLTGFPKLALGKNAQLKGEKLTGWARAVSGMTPAEYTEVERFTTSTNVKVSQGDESWIAYIARGYGAYYVYLTRLPAKEHTVDGKTFYVFEHTRILKTGGVKAFLADPKGIIKRLPDLALATSTRDVNHRVMFNIAQLEAEPAGTRVKIIENFKSSVANRFVCATNKVLASDCHTNNSPPWLPGIGYAPEGPIYVSYHDGGSAVQYGPADVVGIYNMGTTQEIAVGSTVKSVVKKDNRGGWDGWISLDGVYLNGPIGGNPPVKNFQGYAWGSDVVGWLSFDGVGVSTNLNSCTGPYGTAIADGQNFTYYSTPASDGSCQVEERRCTNGALSGSFTAIACGDTPSTEVKKDFCSRAGKIVKNKEQATFYSQSTVRSGKSCEPYKAVLTCNDGLYTNAKGEEDIVHIYGNCRPLPAYGEI